MFPRSRVRQVCLSQTIVVTLLACAASAQQPAPRMWDVPDALGAVDVPGRVEAAGMPVAMHAVRSKRDAASLEQSFRKQFADAGLYLPALKPLSVHRQVTGLDVDTFIAYTVFLQENADHTTTAVLTETFIGERKRGVQDVKFAPLMPGAKEMIVTTSEGIEAVSYRVEASADQVKHFYADVLGKAGYTEKSNGQFERASEILRIRVRASERDASVSVLHS